MNKVVKCKNDKCRQYFMHTEKNTKCPFCYTEYGKVEEDAKDVSPARNATHSVAGGAQAGKKGTTKTQKKSFKIWGGN